ncbi:igLON family member 5-like isoform X2 [Cimex lectularius]|uniref:Ig-like domain-containing protein n=1 Tax=Cimex lectularius TaxID=79782 RepID=A0A8I6TK64_CIMLE|nr:igLON family member 5-like isoform X2 [Cimex lectularius]
MYYRRLLLVAVSVSLLSTLYGQIPNFGMREPSYEELMAKVKERAKTKVHQTPNVVQPTAPPEDLPVFDSTLETNVTAQKGGTAYLHCRVHNLNNSKVTWIRKRDWHILTSAKLTYTTDERFMALHADGSDDWTLQIKFVQNKDVGVYGCQVMTAFGKIERDFNLVVVVPTAYILGTGEYHIGQGSTISLVCVIENSPLPPQYVMWFHNEKMVNYEDGTQTKSRVQVMTDVGTEKTHSRLVITEATSSHSGNYTCRASNTEPDSVYVFVSTDGDNIAAIQRQDASEGLMPSTILLITFVSLSLTL